MGQFLPFELIQNRATRCNYLFQRGSLFQRCQLMSNYLQRNTLLKNSVDIIIISLFHLTFRLAFEETTLMREVKTLYPNLQINISIPVFVDSINQGWGAGVGARCFWLLGAGAAWKKVRNRSRFKIRRLLSPAGR